MQTFGKSPSLHRTASMFIDDKHFIIFDDIFLIFFIHGLCTERILYMMDFFISQFLIEIFDFKDFFQFGDTSSAQCCSLGLFIDIIITVLFLIFSRFVVSKQLLEQSFRDFLLSGTWH